MDNFIIFKLAKIDLAWLSFVLWLVTNIQLLGA